MMSRSDILLTAMELLLMALESECRKEPEIDVKLISGRDGAAWAMRYADKIDKTLANDNGWRYQ
jgi:hypothetical protein